jgi:hypothetical protein
MQLLLYSGGESENGKRLEAAVHKGIPSSRIERLKSLIGLMERLRAPVDPDSIAVLSAASQEELRQMQPLRRLLPEIYVVLVIPDRKKRTIELAHLLLPRFISRQDDDFENLSKVLGKIYRTVHGSLGAPAGPGTSS